MTVILIAALLLPLAALFAFGGLIAAEALFGDAPASAQAPDPADHVVLPSRVPAQAHRSQQIQPVSREFSESF